MCVFTVVFNALKIQLLKFEVRFTRQRQSAYKKSVYDGIRNDVGKPSQHCAIYYWVTDGGKKWSLAKFSLFVGLSLSVFPYVGDIFTVFLASTEELIKLVISDL